jgi:hypothetical protein
MIDTPDAKPAPVSPGIVWLCRIMGVLSILALLFEVGAFVMMLVAPDWLNQPSPAGCSGVCVSHSAGGAPNFRDPVFLTGHALAVAVFAWALWSVRGSFLAIEHGQFFTHRVIVGLRNLAIGVLIRMALDPFSSWLGETIHELSKAHGAISISFGVSDSGLLMVIFTGAVIAITAALAHAAKIAEENASFV